MVNGENMSGNPRCYSEPFKVRVIPMSPAEQAEIRKKIELLDRRLEELRIDYSASLDKRERLINGLPCPKPF